ncbi:MAG: DHH family phosphoesterase [Lachnospiraceae bacterium]|nr:DHH family phosphoesterase [Lachnospiraceae bacterium]
MDSKINIKGEIEKYYRMVLLMNIILILVGTIVLFYEKRLGGAVFVTGFVMLIINGMLYLMYSPKINRELVEHSADINQIQRQMIHELAVPYALLDSKGRIMWTNEAFDSMIGTDKTRNKTANSIFPEINPEEMEWVDGGAEKNISYEDRKLRVVLKEFRLLSSVDTEKKTEADFVNMYMYDETDLLALKKQITEDKMVTGLIYIDNYDEALQNVENVRRTMIFALVERKIHKYITSLDGIVKKLENDKYFIAVKAKQVSKMQSDKFSLLDDVKTVNMGNDLPITISIALGLGGDTFSKNEENARAAMDMALGRGGDQAVIKEGGKIYYYGGKTKSVEKNTRVKARVKAQALRELMLTRDNILVMGHKVGDMDSFGASVGIYRAAKSLDRNVHIVVNEVNSAAKQMFDKFTEDDGYEEDLFLTGEEALGVATKNTLLIVVDVNRPSYTECPELIKKTGSVVVLDHHRQSTEVFENPLLSYIEPYASSACEMVSEIVQYIDEGVKLKQQEADAMYGGIMIDTNNFTNRTGVRTFEAAAFLRRNGADVTRVRKMFRDDMVDYKARATAVQRAEVYREQFAIASCPSEGIKLPTVVGSQAANELLNIKGIKASFVCTSFNDMIYISARSIDEINVQLIMERLGGGGHLNLAGAQLKDCTVQEAIDKIKETIDQMIDEGDLL